MVEEVSPLQALEWQARGAVLLDVREPHECAQGSPKGALRIPLRQVLRDLPDDIGQQTPIVALCAVGQRSLLAAMQLAQAGYRKTFSVAGGYGAWMRENLPAEYPSSLDDDARERYARHLSLPEVGETGQQRLLQATVALVGAGGLGSPVALYLAAAGVGCLKVIDFDVVERSNLQRQILHSDNGTGMAKSKSAAAAVKRLNPGVQVQAIGERIMPDNVEDLLRGADIVIDGSDNFPTRYLLNDAAAKLGMPLVYGAVHRYEGQVGVFWSAKAHSPCYRCLFPEAPGSDVAPNCVEAGVLGVLPGIIGTLQATEAIKLILGIGAPLIGKILHYDALQASFREIRLAKDPACPICSMVDKSRIRYADYGAVCAVRG